MLEMRAFETSPDALLTESLPPLDPFVRPPFISKDETIASEMKSGRSAFIRAAAHLVDEDSHAAQMDLRKAHAHFSKAASLMEHVAESIDLAAVYGFRGIVSVMLNIAVGDPFPLNAAADDLEKSGELLPHRSLYYFLGKVYRQMGALDKALQSLKKAIRLDYAFTDAYFLRGLLYLEIGRIADYEEDFRIAVSLQPDLATREKYGAEFARIQKADEEEDAKWDEAFKLPESETFLNKTAEEVLAAHRRGETKPLKLEDLK